MGVKPGPQLVGHAPSIVETVFLAAAFRSIDGFVDGASSGGVTVGPFGAFVLFNNGNEEGPDKEGIALSLGTGLEVGAGFSFSLPFSVREPARPPQPTKPCKWEAATFAGALGTPTIPPSSSTSQTLTVTAKCSTPMRGRSRSKSSELPRRTL